MMSSYHNKSSAMFLCIMLLLLLAFVDATITVTSTGEHFPSRPDHHLGTHFMEGYEYMARLQVFSHDLHLCPDPSPHSNLNLTVQVPLDGLPVAILARNGGCAVETKARLASYSVHPTQTLKYLIIYGEPTPFTDTSSSDKNLRSITRREPFLQDDDYNDDDGISVGILYVNERSGHELLRTLADQSSTSLKEGGPRILLNGRDYHTSLVHDVVALWVGLAILLLGCLLSFFISVRSQHAAFRHAATTTNEPPTRPRRLSREQVAELVPEFTFQQHEHHHYEACSICLDDYVSGNVLRELPCCHTFHSRCITKWLMERSSTCPLCKTDLLVDDDESSTSSEEPMRSSRIFDWMDSTITNMRTRWRQRRRRRNTAQVAAATTTTTEDEEGVSQQPLLSLEERSSSSNDDLDEA